MKLCFGGECDLPSGEKLHQLPDRLAGEGRQEDTHSLVQQPPAKTQMGQCAGEVHR